MNNLILKKYLVPIILGVLIVIINACRFINLENIPIGMHIDEQTAGVTLTCLSQEGTSPLGNQHYPLFGYNSFATPTPPTYMYPGAVWVKIFGSSISSLRGFTAFAFIITLLGLFAIGRHLGGLRGGLWVMLAGSISPWTWTLSRIAWESTFMLPFLAWGLFFCLSATRHRHFIIAGALLSAAAYSYPPARLQVPLTLILLTCYGIIGLRWKLSHIITLGLSFFVSTIPMGIMYLTDPSLSARFNDLSIMNKSFLHSIGKTGSIMDIAGLIWKNFCTFFDPQFLFFEGTRQNVTLTTGRQGIVSWLDALALVSAIVLTASTTINRRLPSRHTLLLFGFLFLNFLVGLLPPTLISIDNPHPLRALGAWPFAITATGIILHKTTQRWPWSMWPSIIISGSFVFVFLTQYFRSYPKDSIGMFNVWTVVEAKNAKTENDWMTFLYHYHPHMFTSRYFLMRYRGYSCQEARLTWEKLYPFFKSFATQQTEKTP